MLPFETAIIERYKRREASVEEALVEMYLAGVSVSMQPSAQEEVMLPPSEASDCLRPSLVVDEGHLFIHRLQ